MRRGKKYLSAMQMRYQVRWCTDVSLGCVAKYQKIGEQGQG